MSLHYVSFQSLGERPLTIAARFSVPDIAGKHPAVLILHGSAGPSGREGGYAKALNAAGFATLEPDQWSPRGLKGGSEGRPKTITETLPDVFGAKRFLSGRAAIDPSRIGVMGFSFGGIASMLAATRAHNERFAVSPFAAYMPCYPVCWLYSSGGEFVFSDLVDAPVFILTAALDQYDNDPEAGRKLVASLSESDRKNVRTQAMADCHHGFDMPGADFLARDPGGHRGKGGDVIMRYNPLQTTEAHRLAVRFFSEAMK